MADIIGISLGMTKAILKRLAKKRWLMVRKINNRNISYVVSPEGMEAVTKRSYRYLRRTIKNVVYYRNSIEKLVQDLHRRGFSTVILVGESDLSFIVKHFCNTYGLGFATATET
ncbi:MAG: hypothetical protein AB1798_18290 [Spirochaetota bacterium]